MPILAVILLGLVAAVRTPAQQLPRAQWVAPRSPLVAWRGLRAAADRAVVAYEPGASAQEREALHRTLGARVLTSLGPRMALLELPAGPSLEVNLARLTSQPAIRFADPDVAIPLVRTLAVPAPTPPSQAAGTNDPLIGLQWSLERVRAPEAWELTQGSASVVVAILDTGVATDHPDLSAHVAWGKDLVEGDGDPADTHGHGTHCAGLAAAVTDNALGIAGAGHACRFAAYRCGEGSSLPSSLVIAGILDAVDSGAQVLSMSFGLYVDLPSLGEALEVAADAGCVLVGAAGNDAQDVPFFPAAHPDVIGVAASAPNDSRAIFSNFGAWVSVAAPGQSMYSTMLDDGYGYMSGTSMACPLVAGMAALLYAQGGGVRSQALAAAVRGALEGTAVPVSGSWVAAGRVDFAAAALAMSAGTVPFLGGLDPDGADALGGVDVLVTGAGFLGTTGATLGSLPLPVTVLDDTTLRFTAPKAPSLGGLPFVVQKGVADSNTMSFEFTAVSPPRLRVPTTVDVGQALLWEFGSEPGDTWILLASLAPATAAYQGWALLSPHVVGAAGLADEQGLGSFTTAVPASAAGITLHTQVISGPGYLAGATPLAATLVLP